MYSMCVWSVLNIVDTGVCLCEQCVPFTVYHNSLSLSLFVCVWSVLNSVYSGVCATVSLLCVCVECVGQCVQRCVSVCC